MMSRRRIGDIRLFRIRRNITNDPRCVLFDRELRMLARARGLDLIFRHLPSARPSWRYPANLPQRRFY